MQPAIAFHEQLRRDERNEYHGITVERTQRVLDALGSSVTVTAEPAITNQPLRTAAVG